MKRYPGSRNKDFRFGSRVTGAEYEYLGSNVHLYQEGYLKKGPGLGDQENYMSLMPTAPQTLKAHLAHRGTHT